MRVSTTQSEDKQYQHFLGREYSALLEIKRAADFMSKNTTLVSLDNCNGIWLLTVETVKI